MKKILHIVSSPRGGASYSKQLGDAIVAKLQAANPGSVVKTVNLVEIHWPHLEEAHLNSFFTPVENYTDANREAVRHSDEAIRDLNESDVIVIGAPMYNFNIHSALKAWIDHIVRSGKTFAVKDGNPEGLVKGKKVYVAISSGHVYSEGALKSWDFMEPYLRTILGFIGLTDLTFFRVEGTNVAELKEHAMEKAVASIHLN